jgi:hypothetical protein
MAWLSDQLHSLGLKFGMCKCWLSPWVICGLVQARSSLIPVVLGPCSSPRFLHGADFAADGALGYRQCCSGSVDPNATDGSGPGCNKARTVCRSRTYFDQDAKLWASWKIDMLKFDGCGGPPASVKPMRDALNATGRPIVYSVHSSVEQGVMDVSLANMWRTGPDIGASYEQALDRALITNNVSTYLPGARGGWNDPDMLQVGNIGRRRNSGSPPSLFPVAEGRTQFALWCLMKSPLLIGTFLHNISGATLATLTDTTAISVNQDPLGEQGALRAHGGWVPDKPRPTTNAAFGYQIWSGALSGECLAPHTSHAVP